MEKIKASIFFLITVTIILTLLFMFFGSVSLLLEFGVTKDVLTFVGITIILAIPGIVYLIKRFKKLMGIC